MEQAKSSKNIMAPTILKVKPSLWEANSGDAGLVTGATLAKRGRKLWKRSPTRSCTTGACPTAAKPAGPLPKPQGKGFRHRTPPRAAKLDGGVSKPKIASETPCMAQGREASFLFHLDRKRAHTSAKGVPSARVKTIADKDSYNSDVASAGR